MVQNFAQKQIILLAGMTKTFIDTSDQHDENDKNKKKYISVAIFWAIFEWYVAETVQL